MPTHYNGSPRQVLALDTYIKFSRAAIALDSRLFQSAAIEDLTPTQFGVLETLYHLGPLCQGEISTKLLSSAGNMTLVLDNLEKHELVRRERSTEDRRKVLIYLTSLGEETIQRIFPRMAEVIATAFAVLTSEEQKTLGGLCKALGKGQSTN